MGKKFKRGMTGVLLSLLMVLSVLGFNPWTGNVANTTSLISEVNAAANYGLKSNIQDGTILHAFNWTLNDIKNELPNIAAAGFTTVQTSPLQPHAYGDNGDEWYWLYQPTEFVIGNNIGSRQDLINLCNEADKYGIKIMVDVVANHLAGGKRGVPEYLKKYEYYHNTEWDSNKKNVDWCNRYQVTHCDIGLPDLNSEHGDIQRFVRAYVDDLKSCGVDGIRFDAAKHIALPSENCNFWPAVTNNGMYNYGEILVGPDDRESGNEGLMKEYTNYMSVTDSNYGKWVRRSFDSGNAPSGYGNWSTPKKGSIANDKLVYWAESHDTWSNNRDDKEGHSIDMSQNTIDRAYAVVASRNDIAALYFSRPSANVKEQIKMCKKGSTHFTSKEVAAINHFHNAMDGKDDWYENDDNVAVVTRKNGGAVIALGSGSNRYVNVVNAGHYAKTGTYKDEISGNTFTVTYDRIEGTVGSTGIAVIYEQKNPDPVSVESVSLDKTDLTVYEDDTAKLTETVLPSNATNKSVTWFSSDESVATVSNGTVKAHNKGTATITVKTNDGGYTATCKVNVEKQSNNKKRVYFDNTSNWSTVKAYIWKKGTNTAVKAWPGTDMQKDSDGKYYIDVDFNKGYNMIIFTNGSGKQTDDLSIPTTENLYTYKTGKWSVKGDSPVIETKRVYFKNTSNWSTVKAYIWKKGTNNAVQAWPGTDMKKDADGTYYVDVNVKDGYNMIIFTDGKGTQTADLSIPTDSKNYYKYNSNSWSVK